MKNFGFLALVLTILSWNPKYQQASRSIASESTVESESVVESESLSKEDDQVESKEEELAILKCELQKELSEEIVEQLKDKSGIIDFLASEITKRIQDENKDKDENEDDKKEKRKEKKKNDTRENMIANYPLPWTMPMIPQSYFMSQMLAPNAWEMARMNYHLPSSYGPYLPSSRRSYGNPFADSLSGYRLDSIADPYFSSSPSTGMTTNNYYYGTMRPESAIGHRSPAFSGQTNLVESPLKSDRPDTAQYNFYGRKGFSFLEENVPGNGTSYFTF